MARIAVTGGHGQLGRYVVAALEPDYDMTVIDRVDGGSHQPMGTIDLLDLDAVREALRGHDAIIHLAALDFAANARPEDFFHTNTQTAWSTLHAGYEEGIRKFVVCSSSGVYGAREREFDSIPLYLPIDESHPTRATQAYGLSKRVTEFVASSFARRSGVSVIVLRPCYIAYPALVPRLAAADSRPSFEPRPSDGDWEEPPPPLRWYVSPQDAAACFRAALEIELGGYQVFNVSAADSFSSEPTLPLIEALYGRLPEIRRPEVFARNPHASLLDTSRAREILGWTPSGDWALVRSSA